MQTSLAAIKTALSLALTVAASLAASDRAGDLLITPVRLQLDDRSRSGSLVVANLSPRALRYRINVVDMEMLADGTLRRLDHDAENSAKALLRISPREVALAPGASQTIRVLATPGSDRGEFRSHLEFQPISRAGAPVTTTAANGPGLQVNFDVKFVVTIPVIASFGPVTTSAKLSNGSVHADRGRWTANLVINRTGTGTVRGDLVAVFHSMNGKALQVAKMTGLPVYYPTAARTITLPLSKDLSTLGKGELEITYAIEPRRPLSKLEIPVGG